MRNFGTEGPTRSDLGDKMQIEGYLSPLTIRRYGEYMRKHQRQENGELRECDNWQKGDGIPQASYMDSLFRHFLDIWGIHRGYWTESEDGEDSEDLLCALLFNVMGLLHEKVKARLQERKAQERIPAGEAKPVHLTAEDRQDLTEALMRQEEGKLKVEQLLVDFKQSMEEHKDRHDYLKMMLYPYYYGESPDELSQSLRKMNELFGPKAKRGGDDVAIAPVCPNCDRPMFGVQGGGTFICGVHGLPEGPDAAIESFLSKENKEPGFREACPQDGDCSTIDRCKSESIEEYKKLRCSDCKHRGIPSLGPGWDGCYEGKIMLEKNPHVIGCDKFERKAE